jgi:hypothetical protein
MVGDSLSASCFHKVFVFHQKYTFKLFIPSHVFLLPVLHRLSQLNRHFTFKMDSSVFDTSIGTNSKTVLYVFS